MTLSPFIRLGIVRLVVELCAGCWSRKHNFHFISPSSAIVNYKYEKKCWDAEACLNFICSNGEHREASGKKWAQHVTRVSRSLFTSCECRMCWQNFWIHPSMQTMKTKCSNIKKIVFQGEGRRISELCFHLNNPGANTGSNKKKNRNLCKNVIYKIRMQ